ncbi:NMN aminohydrolase [Trichlorobacter ammonificans]|uniref:NMN aminohydrolase n=1 Tax=Trichlorobacter ammonificans TaxID=2916410 RepID=A0ABM9DDG1_9BACT|nr:NMN aminohydrolase [Trichlorobacter ammonificans]
MTAVDEVVADLLRSSGLTLALAESCTGGIIAARITAVPGSSTYFRLGIVAYHNDAKQQMLGVPSALLAEHGAVSGPVAHAMAAGARAAADSDLALAVTGIAGPGGGTAEKPVGTVFIALADRTGCTAHRYQFQGTRDDIRLQTTEEALFLLKNRLLMIKSPVN